jgi:hypothetical protein
MQTISATLSRYLHSRIQTGGRGFTRSVTIQAPGGSPVALNGVKSVSLNRSAQTDADTFTIECDLADNNWAAWRSSCVPDAIVTISQGYGTEQLVTFTGFLDKADEPRDRSTRTIALTGRDWMKHAIVQSVIVTAPQNAGEAGAVRNASNFVYLGWEVSAIVTDLLTHLSFPSSVVGFKPYSVAEFAIADGTSYAAAFSQLASLVAYRSFCDEVGGYHFEAPAVTYSDAGDIVPDAVFRAGGANIDYPDAYDISTLERALDDYELYTRAKVIGPMATTTLTDAWTQTWTTGVIPKPTGVVYDSGEPSTLLILSGSTRKIYTLNQSDRTIASSSGAIPGTVYPAGLSGDPSDSSILWLLDAPWRVGSGTACKIFKLDKSTYAVLATYTLSTNHWADIKADGSVLWLANQTSGLFHTRSKADGSAIASYGPAYTGAGTETRTDPSGLAIDGTTGYLFFAGLAAMWAVDLAAPTVVLSSISTAGTGMIGGEADTTTGTDMYATTDQTAGTVWKYALKVATVGSKTVWVVAIAGVGLVDPEPLTPTGPLETALNNPIRRLILQLPAITSAAQAAETAMTQLGSVDNYRPVMTAVGLGNPALQKGDILQFVDDVMGENSLWNLDTHRSEMSSGYMSTLGLIYIGPGPSIHTM